MFPFILFMNLGGNVLWSVACAERYGEEIAQMNQIQTLNIECKS
jgi:hypothetical protein